MKVSEATAQVYMETDRHVYPSRMHVPVFFFQYVED